MKTSYAYLGTSNTGFQDGKMNFSLFGDANREERVAFDASFSSPLLYRDAMLALREVVVFDGRPVKKDRTEFFEWLEKEIEYRMSIILQYNNEKKQEEIEKKKILVEELQGIQKELEILSSEYRKIRSDVFGTNAWKKYRAMEKEFWQYIYKKDKELWFVLDPVITVHPDIVSYEAFSLDESIYGCLSIEQDFFTDVNRKALGTTNIDFSNTLAKELGRFRTFNESRLQINPEGMTVSSESSDDYLEKKIDLPESWVKGFTQVSSAAYLDGVSFDLSPVDVYDLCQFMKRHKAHSSPRYMQWTLIPGKRIEVTFMPFNKTLTLRAVYNGQKPYIEKVWGRRRWLILEKTLPFATSFSVKLLGFGMPQFVTAHMNQMSLTYGFTAWQSTDWVSGTAFNILAGFVGNPSNYENVYAWLKDNRFASYDDLKVAFSNLSDRDLTSALGVVFKKGEAYYDATDNLIRFRQLFNFDMPETLYQLSQIEKDTCYHLDNKSLTFVIQKTNENELYIRDEYIETLDENKKNINTSIVLSEEGHFKKVNCTCKKFQKGNRNISEPCEHILALYCQSKKVQSLDYEIDKEYSVNEILERFI